MSDLPEPQKGKARRHWSILRIVVRFLFPKRQLPKQLPDAPPTPAELVRKEIEETKANEGTTTTTTSEEKKDESEKRASGVFDTEDSIRSLQKPQESNTPPSALETEPNELKPEPRNTPNQHGKSLWRKLQRVKDMLRHYWEVRKNRSEKTEPENKEIEEATENEGTTTTTTSEEKKDDSEKRASGGFDTEDSIRSSHKPLESNTPSSAEPNELKPEPRNTPNQHGKSLWRKLQRVKDMLRHLWEVRKNRSEKTEPENKEKKSEIEELSEPKPTESQPSSQEKHEKNKGDEEKKAPEVPPPEWNDMDKRLDEILKKASARIVKFEYDRLEFVLKQCLQYFSIFDLDCSIKKRTMIYWWIGEQLAYETSEKVAEKFGEDQFTKLYDGGFINPTLNFCTRTFSEFTVHPLVHWMIKSMDKEIDEKTAKEINEDKEKNKETAKIVEDIPTNLEKKEKPLEKIKKKHEFPHLYLISNKQKENPKDRNGDGAKQGSGEPKGSKERTPEATTPKERSSTGKDNKSEKPSEFNRVLGENTRVLYNVNTKFPLLDEFPQENKLVVLQLGRWHSNQKEYIQVFYQKGKKENNKQVEDFESMTSIGRLKKLRYLGLAGVSQLATLPTEIKKLKRLLVLDLRGCQNLEKLGWEITYLKNLTHLDLTECYMLEYIPKGMHRLSQLQVFKGFVFGGSLTKNRCRLSELSKLKKLRKFSINITSESKIGDNELKDLGKFHSLNSLTITWGEIPVIFSEIEKDNLLKKWTNLSLPPNLEKFDMRCFPKKEMPDWFSSHKNPMKLYIRGGELKTLPLPLFPKIKRLRLRYLKEFDMKWEDIKTKLPHLERVEVEDVNEDPHKKKDIWIRDEVAEANEPTADAPSGQEQEQASTTPPQEITSTIPREESTTNKDSGTHASSTKDAADASTMEEKAPIDNVNDASTPTTQEAAAAPTAQETAINQSDKTKADPHLIPPTIDSENKVPLQQEPEPRTPTEPEPDPPTEPEPRAQATQETAANLPYTTEPTPIPPTTDPSKSDSTVDEPKILLQPVSPETDKHTDAPTAQMTPVGGTNDKPESVIATKEDYSQEKKTIHD